MERIKLHGQVEIDDSPTPRKKRQTTSSVSKITSGSVLLDLVLGGGWACGRIVNIVGDRSSGKTLLAIEAAANFSRKVSSIEDIKYGEAEAAWDKVYAESIGLPEGISFSDPPLETVEDFHDDLLKHINRKSRGPLGLYVLDSLDALSDDAEMNREIDKNSYGGSKAKKMSELLRRLVRKIEAANVTVFVISQIRDKLNVMFGETKTRSGGKALDFYCSQIIWLVEIGKIKRRVLGQERIIGVKVKVKNRKNKVGIPFRECELIVYFNYGVDDEESMLAYLYANPKANVKEDRLKIIAEILTLARKSNDKAGMKLVHNELKQAVVAHWNEIERMLKPVHSKYD